MSNAVWTAAELATELADLFELDSGREREGWTLYERTDQPNVFVLSLGGQSFAVSVEQVRG